MRLLILQACIGRVSSPEDSPTPPADITSTLASAASPESRRQKDTQSWLPSLGTISEDRAAGKAMQPVVLSRTVSARSAVVDYAQRCYRSRSVKQGKGLLRSKSVSSGRVLPRPNSGGRLGLRVVVPNFVPTGFMF